ncbi:MAG: YqaJ viral recombinase family protein [Candidatus Puniceispirillaceae bacterium]
MITKIESETQWHQLRSQTIGGSEVGIVLGCSPYGTLNELYHVKRGNFQNNFDNKLMEWGRAFEPVIAALISGDMYWTLKQCRDYHQHPEYPYLGSTLDYYVVESEHGPGILEIKNVQQFAPNWTQARAPAHVEVQVQHQFMVVNAARKAAGLPTFKWGAIGSLHAGNPEDVRIMYRKPDPKVQKHIIDKCAAFWADVEAGNEPDLIGGHKELDHIVAMYQQAEESAEPELVELDEDAILDDLIMQHENAKFEKSEADRKQKEFKAKILHHLMAVDADGVTRQMAARTKNYGVETKLIEVNRKPQPAKTSTQLRFNIRMVE